MIIIPMAGSSKRFFDAGYQKPKYQLPLHGKSVFFHALMSFRQYFITESFLFILRDEYEAVAFVMRELSDLGIRHYQLHILREKTIGQADTVYRAFERIPEEVPLYIFNIDTFRYDYRMPEFVGSVDGYLEVFYGAGSHWSFVEPGADGAVLRTAEKQRISNMCSDGLYFFRNKKIFKDALHDAIAEGSQGMRHDELYIAPLYNYLIARKMDVRFDLVERKQLRFCGTPDEYEILIVNGIDHSESL